MVLIKTERSMGMGWVYLYPFCTRIIKWELPFIGRVPNHDCKNVHLRSDNDDNVKLTVEVDTYLRFIVLCWKMVYLSFIE